MADTVKNAMTLNNIQDHEDIVREFIFEMDRDDWEEFLDSKHHYLNGAKEVIIMNEVNF